MDWRSSYIAAHGSPSASTFGGTVAMVSWSGSTSSTSSQAMGVDTHGMTDVQAAEAALAAGIRLLRDVGIPEKLVDVKQDSYSKNRLGQGPTEYYKKAPVIKGDKADVDRITNHILGDACTPGNAKECTFDTVRPVVEHCMNGDLDDLLS